MVNGLNSYKQSIMAIEEVLRINELMAENCAHLIRKMQRPEVKERLIEMLKADGETNMHLKMKDSNPVHVIMAYFHYHSLVEMFAPFDTIQSSNVWVNSTAEVFRQFRMEIRS